MNKVEQFRLLAPTPHQRAQTRGDTMKGPSYLLIK